MAGRDTIPGVRRYTDPAGGWGALKATAKAVREQMGTVKANKYRRFSASNPAERVGNS
jgi:hypothetical protein